MVISEFHLPVCFVGREEERNKDNKDNNDKYMYMYVMKWTDVREQLTGSVWSTTDLIV